MAKKLLMALGAVLAVVAGVAALSAYEAHIINVTAHIENALTVHPPDRHLDFGTVFPQEYLTKQFQVKLSTSFQEQTRWDDVTYKIMQKPKCICDDPNCPLGKYTPVDYATDQCPNGYHAMRSLCDYLSKLPMEQEPGDVGEPGYYDPETNSCPTRTPIIPTGSLRQSTEDYADTWVVDLKVPPFAGYVGQDWPAGCPVLQGNPEGEDFGCDLWVEVTGFSPFPSQ